MHNILIVDDDNIFRAKLSAHLSHNSNVRVIQADNGKEAYRIIQNEVVDLLITDVFMPEMDGIELMTKILTNQHKIQSVGVSISAGNAQKTPYEEAMYALGCTHVFSKVDIFHAVKSLINRLPKRPLDKYDDSETQALPLCI